jgi:SagB-type dehydrogenase family enzyme
MSDDGARARRFHQETKHSLESVRGNQHRLIWENQPRPFKLYSDAEAVPLADLAPDSRMHALDALSNPFPADASSSPLTTSLLSSVLHYSAGITKTINHFGQAMKFRAAACTGALYHVDVYAVTGELDNLKAGVYQFGPQDGQLRRLRSGDFRSALIEACGGEEQTRQSDAMLVLTTTFWRNSWKYQARAYRHAFWDSGTMLANTLGVARAHDLRASVVLGFNDDAVNALLGLDAEREVAIALVALGESSTQFLSHSFSKRIALQV